MRPSRRFLAGLLLLMLLPFLSYCGLKEAGIKRQDESIAFYKFGVAYLGDNPPALQNAYIEFQKAVEADPKNRDARYALGHVHFELQNYQEAIEAFKQIIEKAPDDSEAHNYLGRVYAFLGEDDLAIAAYENALKNKQYATPEAPYWNMGLVYLRQKNYKYSVQALKNALRMNSAIAPIHNQLGEVYAKMGDVENAVASYERALEVNPDDLNAHYNLACIYQREGVQTLADAEFDRVVALSPALKAEKDLKQCASPVE